MWLVYSLAAAMCWGITLNLGEHLYKQVHFSTIMVLGCLPSCLFYLIMGNMRGTFLADVNKLTTTPEVWRLFAAQQAIGIFGGLMIALGIVSKNATLTGMIEISYPIFTALFAYYVFKQGQLSPALFVGCGFIFTGVMIVFQFAK